MLYAVISALLAIYRAVVPGEIPIVGNQVPVEIVVNVPAPPAINLLAAVPHPHILRPPFPLLLDAVVVRGMDARSQFTACDMCVEDQRNFGLIYGGLVMTVCDDIAELLTSPIPDNRSNRPL